MTAGAHPAPLLVLAVLLAGCLGPVGPDPGDPVGTGGERLDADPEPPHAPPTFLPSVRVAQHDGYGFAAEPAVSVAPDGRFYVAAPYITARDFLADGIVVRSGQGAVWRSDDGSTFQRLGEGGRLAGEHASTSDTDVAVDAAGTLYFANGGGSGHLLRSDDGGATWSVLGAVDGRGRPIDRPWLLAHGDGVVTVTWAVQDADPRAVAFKRSTDGGRTWSEEVDLAEGMAQFGPPAASADGTDLYQPYVRDRDNRLRVLVSHDGGATWDDADAGRTLIDPPNPGTPLAASPTAVFPVAAVDAAGTAYLAWSEYRDDGSTRVAWTRSRDGGATWDAPTVLTETGNAVMPWLVAGDAGRVALLYLGASTSGDPNVGVHEWFLEVRTTVDGGYVFVASRATPEPVHVGSVCPHGAACAGYVTPFVGDRSLLDYFEAALGPDGALVVAWAQTRTEDARNPDLRFSRQDGGLRLA